MLYIYTLIASASHGTFESDIFGPTYSLLLYSEFSSSPMLRCPVLYSLYVCVCVCVYSPLSVSLLYCSVATTVEMADDSFNEDHFEHIAGLLHVMWDRVPAGGNVTHAVIVRPTVFGVYNMSYARITYTADQEGTSVVRVVW